MHRSATRRAASVASVSSSFLSPLPSAAGTRAAADDDCVGEERDARQHPQLRLLDGVGGGRERRRIPSLGPSAWLRHRTRRVQRDLSNLRQPRGWRRPALTNSRAPPAADRGARGAPAFRRSRAPAAASRSVGSVRPPMRFDSARGT